MTPWESFCAHPRTTDRTGGWLAPHWGTAEEAVLQITLRTACLRRGVMLWTLSFLPLFFPYCVSPFPYCRFSYVFLYYHRSCISFFGLLFCIDSLLLSFVSLLSQRLCMVPIKGPAVPVPDDAIMASCVGTAFCAALQCTCLGLFGLLDWYIRTPCTVVKPQNCSGLIPV